jgi:hypothetical protein
MKAPFRIMRYICHDRGTKMSWFRIYKTKTDSQRLAWIQGGYNKSLYLK